MLRPLLAAVLLSVSVQAADKPNFILVLADDLGYGDLSVYGAPNIRTPHLDRLAAEGVKLTDFYSVSPVCTPSRAGLLTGRYPVRSGMVRVLFPREQAGLPAQEITLAEALGELGYATAMIGKWHLGDRPEHSPLRHGFDVRFGLPFSNDMTRPHTSWPEPLRLYSQDDALEEGVDQTTLTQRYVDRAIQFLEDSKPGPFFLYLPLSMPHWPWYSSQEFDGRSLQGPYGDTIEEIDANIGRLLAVLDRLGLADDTLVMFTSDNGAAGRPGAGSNGALRGFKGQVFEGGMREPFLARWPGKIPAGAVAHGLACTMDLFPTLVKLAGGAPPSDRPFDGVDIAALLRGEGPSPRQDLYYWSHNWESEPQLLAVRDGRWKLHFEDLYEWPQETFQPTELYDLHADPAERFDLAKQHPEIVERLTRKARKFHADTRMGALPPTHFPPGSPGSPRSGGVSRAEQRAKRSAEIR